MTDKKDYIANKCVEMVITTAVLKAADVICYLKKHDFSKDMDQRTYKRKNVKRVLNSIKELDEGKGIAFNPWEVE